VNSTKRSILDRRLPDVLGDRMKRDLSEERNFETWIQLPMTSPMSQKKRDRIMKRVSRSPSTESAGALTESRFRAKSVRQHEKYWERRDTRKLAGSHSRRQPRICANRELVMLEREEFTPPDLEHTNKNSAGGTRARLSRPCVAQ